MLLAIKSLGGGGGGGGGGRGARDRNNIRIIINVTYHITNTYIYITYRIY